LLVGTQKGHGHEAPVFITDICQMEADVEIGCQVVINGCDIST